MSFILFVFKCSLAVSIRQNRNNSSFLDRQQNTVFRKFLLNLKAYFEQNKESILAENFVDVTFHLNQNSIQRKQKTKPIRIFYTYR